ncbi:MAG: hypothetical protein JNL80_12820 [Phycisphaerae bacterium]|nr:hypothetical protein [Phycisphaerae bacterium]
MNRVGWISSATLRSASIACAVAFVASSQSTKAGDAGDEMIFDRAWDLSGSVWMVRSSGVSRFIDTNGDGALDRETSFIERLIGARAVKPLSGDAAFVLEPPNLLLVRDRNGDGRGETTSVVASGLGGGNSLVITSDGWLLVGGTRLRFRWDGRALTRWEDLERPLLGVAPTASGDLLAIDGGAIRLWPGDPARLPGGRLDDAAAVIVGAVGVVEGKPEFGWSDSDGLLNRISFADSQLSVQRPDAGWRWRRHQGQATGAPFEPVPGELGTQALLPLLASPNAMRRTLALEALVFEIGDGDSGESVVAPLRALARDNVDPSIRRLAFCALDRIGMMEAADVQAAAADPSPVVRRFASSLGAGQPLAARLADPLAAISATALLDASIAAAERSKEDGRLTDELLAAARGRETLLLDRLLARMDADGRAAGRNWWLESTTDRVLGSIVASGDPVAQRQLLERAASRREAGDSAVAANLIRAAFSATQPNVRRHAIVRLDRAPKGYAALMASDVGGPFRPLDAWVRWPDRSDVEAPSLATTPEETIELGRRVYSACMTCHGPAGVGQDGVYPPLAASPYVNGDPERFAKILLHGLQGRVTVGTKEVVGLMPPPVIETDEEIAAVMTYVRQAFGNAAPPVSPSVVRAVRERHASRMKPWEVTELEGAATNGGGTTP